MKPLHIYTIFEKHEGRPRYTGIKIGDRVEIYELYRTGARKPISVIEKNKDLIRSLILKANSGGSDIIVSDFKSHISAFDLPLNIKKYNVYDVHLSDVKPSDNQDVDMNIIRSVLNKLSSIKVKEYQKVMANAAVVYHDLQQRGLSNNWVICHPQWSMKTFSGRSKTMGFNIQGYTDNNRIAPPSYDGNKIVMLHFDWVCADIRVASLLSEDKKLEESFLHSDPYTYMMEIINKNQSNKISRDECKLNLLKSINSMNYNNQALSEIYKSLGDWIRRCDEITKNPEGFLETILQRRFRMAHAKNNLAVLNGAMQGSIAHAMQNTIRRVWEKIGDRIVAEVHDSLITVSVDDSAAIKSVISSVTDVMTRPFRGLLESDPFFPVKVSIGKKWRQWKLFATYRESGVIYEK